MPLAGSESVLAALIKTELDTEFPIGTRDINPADRQKAAEAIARAILNHLIAQPLTVIGTAPAGGGPLVGGKLV